MPKDFLLLCLDTETSGTKPAQDYGLLSLAAKVFETGEEFYAEMDWEYGNEVGSYLELKRGRDILTRKVDFEAMNINQLQPTSQCNGIRHSLDLVDEAFEEFLRKVKSKVTPMGLNVGGFDLDYISVYLPKSSRLLGYRAFDLNTLFMKRAIDEGKAFTQVRDPIMKAAEEEAKKRLPDLQPHNSLFDVYAECFQLAYLNDNPEPWMIMNEDR